MLFVDRDRGLVELEFRSDDAASFIGKHHRAIRDRLGGDDEALADFENKQVRIGKVTFRPETNVEVLVDLYNQGELDYQDPYDTAFLNEGTEEG